MNPKCVTCEKVESILWRKTSETTEICNDCYETNIKNEIKDKKKPPEPPQEIPEVPVVTPVVKVRKSTRSTRYKKSNNKQKTKSNSRRNLLKKGNCSKTPLLECAQSKTATHVFHEGSYIQIGDIVSMQCKGKTYYAQIRNFLIDSFNEKSAVISWLIPSRSSPNPNEEFDASTYLIGLEEDIPRRIEAMQFVQNAPSNYFKSNADPFPKPSIYEDDLYDSKNKSGYVWTSI